MMIVSCDGSTKCTRHSRCTVHGEEMSFGQRKLVNLSKELKLPSCVRFSAPAGLKSYHPVRSSSHQVLVIVPSNDRPTSDRPTSAGAHSLSWSLELSSPNNSRTEQSRPFESQETARVTRIFPPAAPGSPDHSSHAQTNDPSRLICNLSTKGSDERREA